EIPMSAEASEGQRTYIPAATYDWLLPLYDVFGKLMGTEAAHRELVDQADIEPGHHVLDIGCGTGNLTLLVKRLQPRAEVVGLDPDPKALARARRKGQERGLAVRFDRGFSDELPYVEASFDRVFSALMLHHLALDTKEKTLREVRRVLRSGGAFYALDFDGTNGLIAPLFPPPPPADQHRIPGPMHEAGFAHLAAPAPRDTSLGRAPCL